VELARRGPRVGEPTNEGHEEPDEGGSDLCPPFAGFRVRVCVSATAWRIQTRDHLQGQPSNNNAAPTEQPSLCVSSSASRRRVHSLQMLLEADGQRIMLICQTKMNILGYPS
jgi:hypothetical protein